MSLLHKGFVKTDNHEEAVSLLCSVIASIKKQSHSFSHGKIFFCKLFVVLPLMILISACGFQPMYGNFKYSDGQLSESVTDKLAVIDIALIPDRSGVALRNRLIDRFYTEGYPQDPRYVLKIDRLSEHIRGLDVTKTADATRGQLKLTTQFVLRDDKGQELIRRNISATSSYNILVSEFNNRVSEQHARQSAILELAEQIEMYISLYFNRV